MPQRGWQTLPLQSRPLLQRPLQHGCVAPIFPLQSSTQSPFRQTWSAPQRTVPVGLHERTPKVLHT